MRACTLVLSVVFHLCVAAAIVVVPLFATGRLPTPPHSTTFIRDIKVMPRQPAEARRAPERTALSAGAPLEAPEIIAPERPAAVVGDPVPVPIGIDGGSSGLGVPFESDPSPVELVFAPPARQPRAPIHVGGLVQPPQKVKDVAPRYPSLALASRVHGIVILEAVIGEDGSVTNVRVLKSVQLLDEAAIEAVRQWRFSPTRLNGVPVPVVMTVTVAFNLQ